MKQIYLAILFCIGSQFISKAYSQKLDSVLQTIQQFPEKYLSIVDNKISSIDDKLTKQTVKYLQKLQRQEEKIKKHLQKIDSSTSVVFTNAKQKYAELTEKIKSKTAVANKITGGQYNSYMDSLSTSLAFLKQFNNISGQVKKPLNKLHALQSKLHQAEKIKEFIGQRKEQIKQVLSKYTKLPNSLRKEYGKLSKTAYYYSAQIKEYKGMLQDPKKIEQKALSLLNKLPAFQKFTKENSQLASLFGIPGNSDPSAALAGLQTRASVQSLIQQQISMGGPNAQAQIQQNLAKAHAEINKLKDKINQFGGGSSDIEMPDFKPNDQKTKSFLKRLEFGSNIQFAKSNSLLPTTTDIGLSIGYKLNDKSIIGIGTSYKMGLGSIRHISITHQGIGLRSFVEYKIKKQFFVSGGYEMNYNAQFKNIEQLKNYAAWQQSGLIGLSKKYKISKKVKGEMKLLYDFLASQHIPVSQPFVYRLGYKF